MFFFVLFLFYIATRRLIKSGFARNACSGLAPLSSNFASRAVALAEWFMRGKGAQRQRVLIEESRGKVATDSRASLNFGVSHLPDLQKLRRRKSLTKWIVYVLLVFIFLEVYSRLFIDFPFETAEEVAILRDALRYREAVARKESAKAKVENKPPVAKPSAKKSAQTDQQRSRKQAKARMEKTGEINDVASYLILK